MQKKIYVLQEAISRKLAIFRKIEDSVPKPVAPQECRYLHQTIPDYDEEKYVKLAKAKGSGLGKFRQDAIFAGLALAGTIIGLLIFWIPLLLAFLSWPYSIYHTRKMAYKLYIEDCKELENQNECNKIELERFNRASMKYQHDLQLYQIHQSNLAAKREALEREFQFAQNALTNLKQEYFILFGESGMSSAYQDFASINMIYSYMRAGQADSARDAVQLFQHQAGSGRIITNLEYIKKNYSLYQNSMPEVVKALKECSSYVDSIERDLIEYIKTETKESTNTKNTLLRKYILNSLH